MIITDKTELSGENMNFQVLPSTNRDIAVVTGSFCINTLDDALELIANISYQTGCDGLVLEQKHLHPDFFDLKTGFAGQILQKFTTYNMRLGIVGDFSAINSKSFNDFMYESNKKRKIVFVDTAAKAIEILSA
ncbi:hypothetical protein FACS189464_1470 [Bacteroidia bacterium]|nr:hypothetical protein FACS189430_12430 [Bacteroidia bacterium]GHT78285.1 hypothetical protein FACS189464_1470 [Bacteroidia bacterium]